MLRHRNFLLLPLALLLLAVAACNDDPAAPSNGGGDLPEGVVPDVALRDVNATSATFDQDVSPRDYLQKVSAWYFGHAT
jgi:hypothetical protein